MTILPRTPSEFESSIPAFIHKKAGSLKSPVLLCNQMDPGTNPGLPMKGSNFSNSLHFATSTHPMITKAKATKCHLHMSTVSIFDGWVAVYFLPLFALSPRVSHKPLEKPPPFYSDTPET